MQFEVWFTLDATKEGGRMCRRWYYWPLFVVRNSYGFALIAVLLVNGVVLPRKSLLAPSLDLRGAGLASLLLALPAAGFLWYRNRDTRKANELLAGINPLSLTFQTDGLLSCEKNGSRNFAPWDSFDGYREGRAVLMLRETATREHRVIPKNTRPPADVERLCSAVRSRLPEIRA